MSNFTFLQVYWPDFAKTLDFAEKYVYTDPASSKNKSGLFVELMVREIMRIEKIPEPEYDNTHYTRTKILKSEGLLPYDVNQWINQVRIKRNDSAHENIAFQHSFTARTFSKVTCAKNNLPASFAEGIRYKKVQFARFVAEKTRFFHFYP